jgi:hypothetical protein
MCIGDSLRGEELYNGISRTRSYSKLPRSNADPNAKQCVISLIFSWYQIGHQVCNTRNCFVDSLKIRFSQSTHQITKSQCVNNACTNHSRVSMYIIIIIIISNLSDDRSKASSKRFLHLVWSRASSFKWEYPLLSPRSSSSFLSLLPHLLVTSICPFIFPSITCFRRQFLRKIWPIQLAFRLLISCRIFLCSLTLSNTSSFLTWSVRLIFSV